MDKSAVTYNKMSKEKKPCKFSGTLRSVVDKMVMKRRLKVIGLCIAVGQCKWQWLIWWSCSI